jgi:tRNA nucleotidyltransferase/poly(A) polymerase
MTAIQLEPGLHSFLAAAREAVPDVYLVGGGVRDLLRGTRPADLDFVTATDCRRAAHALASALQGHAFPLDEERGYYRILLIGHPSVEGVDLSQRAGDVESDLRRRDFTINAIAAPVEPDGSLGALVDPCGGLADLKAKRLRMVSEQALQDDPLRLLRAARLAAELDFSLDAATADAISRNAPLIEFAAEERQRDEFVRLLATPRAAAGIRLLDSLGLLAALLPELEPARGVEQPGRHHYWDVFDHSVETLAALDTMLSTTETDRPWLRDGFEAGLAWYPLQSYLGESLGSASRLVLLKLAGLLHDVAKPETKSVGPDGSIHFLGHPELGAGKATRICERLRFGNRETRFVSLLVEEHLRPTQLAARGEPPSARALYRFYRDLEDAAPACLILMLADGAAAAGPRLTQQRWRAHVAYVIHILESEQAQLEAAKGPRLITGHDLMSELGLEPGPRLGELLAAVEEAIGAGEIATREAALAYARRLVEQQDHGSSV